VCVCLCVCSFDDWLLWSLAASSCIYEYANVVYTFLKKKKQTMRLLLFLGGGGTYPEFG